MDELKTQTDLAGIPEGFEPFKIYKGFVATVGPLYMKRDGNRVFMGLRVEDRHCNIAGICHGGMLMTLADMQCGIGARFEAGLDKFMPTINMTCDFVASARLGDWIQGESQLVRRTRNLAFASCLLRVGEENVFRGSAIMKIPSDRNPNYADVKVGV